MAISKLTDDLNIISSLPDRPTLTSQELKEQFDKASNLIKKYINEKLTEEVGTELQTTIESAKAYVDELSSSLEESVNSKVTELETSVNKSISDMQTSLNSSVSSLNTNVGKKTSYGDFLITRNSYQSQSGGIVSTSSRNADLYHSVSQSGYYPIALVGVRGTSTEDKFDYRHGYLSNQANGSCIAHWIFTNNEGGSFNANDLPACEVEILWVKVR